MCHAQKYISFSAADSSVEWMKRNSAMHHMCVQYDPYSPLCSRRSTIHVLTGSLFCALMPTNSWKFLGFSFANHFINIYPFNWPNQLFWNKKGPAESWSLLAPEIPTRNSFIVEFEQKCGCFGPLAAIPCEMYRTIEIDSDAANWQMAWIRCSAISSDVIESHAYFIVDLDAKNYNYWISHVLLPPFAVSDHDRCRSLRTYLCCEYGKT